MKEITGSASAFVEAPADECYALLAAVERYGEWNGELVRELEVLDRDGSGRAARIRAVIHVRQSPFVKTFELTVAVSTEPPRGVHIARIPNETSDREALELTWRIGPDGGGTKIDLEFVAVASFVPGFMPVGGVGNAIAQKLLESAAHALEPRGSPDPEP